MPVYNSLTSSEVNQLAASTNAVVGSGNAFGIAAGARGQTYSTLGSSTGMATVQTDTTGMSLTVNPGVTTFFESVQSTPSNIPTMTLTTNHSPVVVILGTTSGINFTDAGSSGDQGDTIYGDNGRDSIAVVQGNNFVVAGSGATTLRGGSGADTLWGGGNSSVVGGSGSNEKLVGGLSNSAMDTVVGGSGSATLWAGYGHVTMTAGTGSDQFWSGVAGDDSMTLNDMSFVSMRAGNANVTIVGGADSGSRDTVSSSSSNTGNMSITSTAGDNLYGIGSGFNTINSSADDEINLVNGGHNTVISSGSGADSVYVGATQATDSITAGGSHAVDLIYSTSISITSGPSGSPTVIHFSNGTTVTYSGAAGVTLTHSNSTF